MTVQAQSEETPSWKQPSHPKLIKVVKGDGSFSAHAVSLTSLPAGAVFCDLSAANSASKRTYATVQAALDRDINLNSDLLYCNHSCAPSLVFDTGRMEVRVADDRPLREGDALTIFYPAFEWDMSQAFDCKCGESTCVGTVKGAKHLDRQTLGRYWLNDHIKQLAANEPLAGENGLKN